MQFFCFFGVFCDILRSKFWLIMKIWLWKLFITEGCMICLNDTFHNNTILKGIPNLHIIMMMKSFESKKFVRKTYAWKHHYWFLTNEGIEYLRGYLQLPSTIVPNTLKVIYFQNYWSLFFLSKYSYCQFFVVFHFSRKSTKNKLII